jgi:hypothetical protein
MVKLERENIIVHAGFRKTVTLVLKTKNLKVSQFCKPTKSSSTWTHPNEHG